MSERHTPRSVMCHVVAGYPDFDTCLRLMQGMQREGVTAIEVQIPFSDPIADGETIMDANDVALASGMTTAGSFELIQKARTSGVDIDMYSMSYLQKVQHFGLAEFCEQAAKSFIRGLIIPDLPYDTPEFTSLLQLTIKNNLELVSVLSPAMLPKRLEAILKQSPKTLYITSSQGITGNHYAPAAELRELVKAIRQQSDATIMIGFGVRTPEDVTEVLAVGDVAVVGSAVIQKIKTSGLDATLAFVRSLVAKP